MLITNNEDFFHHAKHISTTAKVPHKYEFIHDQIGYNYRMPNLNAALGCSQLKKLDKIIYMKRKLARVYKEFFENFNVKFVEEESGSTSNYWLNTVIFNTFTERTNFLEITNDEKIMTRPAWRLMSNLDMFKDCLHCDLNVSESLEKTAVNIPSSVPLHWYSES